MIVHFVYISGIVDHQCLKLPSKKYVLLMYYSKNHEREMKRFKINSGK